MYSHSIYTLLIEIQIIIYLINISVYLSIYSLLVLPLSWFNRRHRSNWIITFDHFSVNWNGDRHMALIRQQAKNKMLFYLIAERHTKYWVNIQKINSLKRIANLILPSSQSINWLNYTNLQLNVKWLIERVIVWLSYRWQWRWRQEDNQWFSWYAVVKIFLVNKWNINNNDDKINAIRQLLLLLKSDHMQVKIDLESYFPISIVKAHFTFCLNQIVWVNRSDRI